ncbi:MAG: hypothetical protein Q8K23_00735, partial [Sulfuritalea sp.]|nr:hypothetical protein [Sulfuritalea sp.]
TDVNSYHDDLDQLEGKYIDFVRFTIPIEDRYVLKSKGDAKKFRATDQTRLKASFEQAAKIIDALLARIALSGAAISINEPGRP